ncbi:hypothetical protein JW887_06500 [Candidatus Dojkabacteria bacterium]|nr:hypothetical protein [Candidatus Dojkabacteria bacterium]
MDYTQMLGNKKDNWSVNIFKTPKSGIFTIKMLESSNSIRKPAKIGVSKPILTKST